MKKQSWIVVGLLSLVAIGVWAATGDIHTWTGMGSRRNTVEFTITEPTVGSAAAFNPGTTNTNALGTTSLRFSNVYTTLLNVSGASTLTGAATVSGLLTANQANVSIQVSTAPRTSSAAIVTSTGTLIWNSTDGGLCVSSGLAQTTMVASSAPTTACGH